MGEGGCKTVQKVRSYNQREKLNVNWLNLSLCYFRLLFKCYASADFWFLRAVIVALKTTFNWLWKTINQ